MIKVRCISVLFLLLFSLFAEAEDGAFCLFNTDMKTQYPSVVYDFLEHYLYELDSLNKAKVYIEQRIKDDNVVFHTGSPSVARRISPTYPVSINRVEDKYYEVAWSDTLGNTLLDISFPIQFELLLGKPKAEIEKELKMTMQEYNDYYPAYCMSEDKILQEDGCSMSNPVSNYYIESMNTATYYKGNKPTFDARDKWHSAANLFQGCIDSIGSYMLYIEQNLYGFKTMQYTLPLTQWLAYCQAMKITTYVAVEEEREDGLKLLLIAQCRDLGFNHMMSIIVPWNFVDNRKSVLKAQLNAYIPTNNVKDLYQQYKDKPKKRI